MARIQIEVVNWEKYNPRSDRKHHTWFRLENTIIAEPKFFGLSAGQKFAAICILAEASKNSGKCDIHVEWLCDQIKIKKTELDAAIDKLVSNGVIRLPLGPITSNHVSLRTYERTNVRTDGQESPATDVAPSPLPELAKIWNEEKGPVLAPVIAAAPGTPRRKKADARWRAMPDPAYWRQVIRRILESDFCLGKNDRGWRADFEFLIATDTATKVLEGKYDNTKPVTQFKGIAEILKEQELSNAAS